MTNLDSKMLDFIDDFALSEADLNECVEFLLSAFLPQKMITTIYADGGNGKSYLSAAVAKAKAHLSKASANKTQLLLACGFEKDDKFARGVLDDFEGIFWRVSSGGYKNKALFV